MPGLLLINNVLKDPATLITGFTGLDILQKFEFCLNPRLSLGALWNTPVLSQQIDIDLGSAKSIGAAGIAGHNFGSYAGDNYFFRLAYSFDDITYQDAALTNLVDGNSQIVSSGSNINARYWRIRIEGNTGWNNPKRVIGYLSLGELITLDRIQAPITPPTAQPWDSETHYSERGDLISQDRYFLPLAMKLDLKNYDENFFLTNYQKFAESMLREPFFYLWNTNEPNQAVYAWIDKSINLPKFNSNYLLDWAQPINAIKRVF